MSRYYVFKHKKVFIATLLAYWLMVIALSSFVKWFPQRDDYNPPPIKLEWTKKQNKLDQHVHDVVSYF